MVLGGFDDSIKSYCYEIVTIAYCVSYYSKQYGRQKQKKNRAYS